MFLLVVLGLVLLGGTTWLAQQQSIAVRPALNHQLTGMGLVLCLAVGLAAVVGAVVLG